jgi:hypothetical protein
MRLSHIRPYEVIRVRPDEGLDLRDLWTRKVIQVRECLATRDLVPWGVLLARLVLGPAGVPVIDGQAVALPATEAEPLMKGLKREHREFRRRMPDADLLVFFKRIGMVFHHVWLDTVALRPMPTVVTAEGDEIVIARVSFDVLDGATVSAALARHPELVEQDDGSYVARTGERRAGARPPSRQARHEHDERDTASRARGPAERGRRIRAGAPGGSSSRRCRRREPSGAASSWNNLLATP